MNVSQALKHPWIKRASGELAQRNLDSNLKALRRYNARRKILAVANAARAANRFKMAVTSRKDPGVTLSAIELNRL